jgi:hypothetical protein
MLIVFPFSKQDLALAIPLMQWMRELGPYDRHNLLLAYSEELSPDEREAVAVNARQCGWAAPPIAFTVRIPTQQWPDAPNEIFRQAAELIWRTPEFHKAWYFMEPDVTPMREGWADALADEYNRDLSLPFMGVVDTTYSVNSISGELVKTGEHLCGCAVYPPNLSHYTTAHLNATVAFDHAIAPQIRPHARNTPLCQDNWSTGNYHRSWGRIVCEPVTFRVALAGRSVTRPVRPDAVVLHGCKDGSLLKLLRDSRETDRQEALHQINKRKRGRSALRKRPSRLIPNAH